ncbi:MAG: hypothetical protein OCD76_19825 [Reichenbachiella sp.]
MKKLLIIAALFIILLTQACSGGDENSDNDYNPIVHEDMEFIALTKMEDLREKLSQIESSNFTSMDNQANQINSKSYININGDLYTYPIVYCISENNYETQTIIGSTFDFRKEDHNLFGKSYYTALFFENGIPFFIIHVILDESGKKQEEFYHNFKLSETFHHSYQDKSIGILNFKLDHRFNCIESELDLECSDFEIVHNVNLKLYCTEEIDSF